MKKLFSHAALIAAGAALLLGANVAQAMDDEDVVKLMKKNNCMKCHAPEKKKDGPSYKEIAAKMREKPAAEAEAEVLKHVTTFSKVEIKGKQEDHEPLKTKDEAEIAAVVKWILSRP